jgi:hypothetical protein
MLTMETQYIYIYIYIYIKFINALCFEIKFCKSRILVSIIIIKSLNKHLLSFFPEVCWTKWIFLVISRCTSLCLFIYFFLPFISPVTVYMFMSGHIHVRVQGTGHKADTVLSLETTLQADNDTSLQTHYFEMWA